ncbi:MAG: peptidylprolyl isomerase [Microbacteriaceae bacterium]|nr:peptidylprolyl isomerase [Microbacteriaceae bacterium]
MAPSKNADREAREARLRQRKYAARKAVNAQQVGRRRRDNLGALIGVTVIVALATVAQVLYFSAGPGKTPGGVAASPSASAKPGASASPNASPNASPSVPPTAEKNIGNVPAKTIAKNRVWTGDLTINNVDLAIKIDGKKAPQAASVFISLAKSGYYNGNSCHRLTTDSKLKVLQCGQPNTTTSIDPGFSFGPIENAPEDGVYPAGTIAMARTTSVYGNSTQFFVTYGDSYLDPTGGGYTVLGSVTKGLDGFITDITSAGVTPAANGAASSDGTPVVPAVIRSVTLR